MKRPPIPGAVAQWGLLIIATGWSFAAPHDAGPMILMGHAAVIFVVRSIEAQRRDPFQ